MSITFEKDQAKKIIARVGKIRGILVPEPSNENGIDNVLCALMEEGYKLHPETIEQFAGETAYSKQVCWDFYGLSLNTRVTSGLLIVAVYDDGLSFELDRKINADELHFASVRGGDIPGTHVVGFDSTADTIELKHTARSREGFALGAIMTAQWLKGKKGFFTILL